MRACMSSTLQQVVRGLVLIGLGVGVWLGMRKGDEIIAAGTSMVTAAAVSNITGIMERVTGND